MVRPTYDPKTRTWFYGTREAPTIRELLEKMPQGTEVADYYPNGGAPIPNWPLDTDTLGRITLPSNSGTLPRTLGTMEEIRKKARRRVSKEIKYHRERKKKKRETNGVDWWSPQDETMLRVMVQKGEKTYTEMAAVLCREREAVAGKIDRMRKDGKL